MNKLLLALLLATALPAAAVDEAARPLDLFGTLGEKAGGLFGGQQQFLPADEVFIPSVEAGDDAVQVWFDIRDGYYLYRDKFRFQARGARLGGPSLPPPTEVHEDPHFGTMAIYKGRIGITLPLRSPPAGDFELKLRYQGCAEDGICYPPIDKVIPVQWSPVAAATAAPAIAATAGNPEPEQDRITALLAGSSLWLILLSFYGFGLLLAFTPCVFPMVPILSGIIVGQGEKITAGRGLFLSSAYVLAMALTYAVVGVVAAIFGANLQASFQSPVVLVVFAGLFVALALSMFGLYPLELPKSWQAALSRTSNHQPRGTWHGAFVMGLLSALIVGPCVAPPLAGTLLYIGATGDAVLGGTALFVMGLGMGTPLLLIGASAGHWLPKAGVWMEAVKAVFGVLLLAVAIWLLERILPPAVTLFLWAALLIVASIYMGAFDPLEAVATGWRRLWKGLGLILFVWGVLLVIGAASGARDPLRPLEPGLLAGAVQKVAQQEERWLPIKGTAGLEAALKQAGGRPVLLDFSADWCVECRYLEQTTFRDPAVTPLLSRFLLLRADVTENDDQDSRLLRSMGLYGPPALLFFRDGRELRNHRLIGYVDPADFSAHLQRVLEQCSATSC